MGKGSGEPHICQLLCIIAGDDVAEDIPDQDKFKYIDNLSVVEAVATDGKLINYYVIQHVPSDEGIGQQFLSPNTLKTQN